MQEVHSEKGQHMPRQKLSGGQEREEREIIFTKYQSIYWAQQAYKRSIIITFMVKKIKSWRHHYHIY